MKEDAKKLAKRFVADRLWCLREGRRVRFTKDVVRDEFIVPKGRVGTIMSSFLDSEGRLVLSVKLRTPLPGMEEYDGEVHWLEGVNIEEVETDLELA